jgi:hypothetical protein
MNYGWAFYRGATRLNIFAPDVKYKIVDVSQDGTRLALDPGNGKIEWMHVRAVEYTTAPGQSRLTVADNFMEPNKETLSNIDAEIKRLEERLTALRAARAVVASL